MIFRRLFATLSIIITTPFASFADVVTAENYTHALPSYETLNITSGGSITVTDSSTAVLFQFGTETSFEGYLNTSVATLISSQAIAVKHQGGSYYDPYDYAKTLEEDDFTITNQGTISGATAIQTRDVGLTVHNSGAIIGDVSVTEARIENSGTINGNISAQMGAKEVIGALEIINTGIINGDIDIGDYFQEYRELRGESVPFNDGSYVTLNDGSITGDITIGDNTQEVNLNGGVYSGTIDGAGPLMGTVNVNSNQTFGIGEQGVENLNVLAGSTFTPTSSNVKASHIALAGSLDLGSTNKNIAGDVAGNGSSRFDVGSGSHTVQGDVTIQSGDTIAVTLSESGDVGNATALGTVTVQSGAKIAATVGSTYSYINNGAKYKLVSGDSASSIAAVEDANINVNESGTNQAFSVLTFTSRAENNGLYLHVARAGATQVTDNKVQQEVYDVVNDIGSGATGELENFQQYLDSSTSKQQISEALDSATPQDTSGTQVNSINTLNNSARTIEKRLDFVRLSSHDTNAKKRFKLSSKKQQSGIASGDKGVDKEVWGQVFGSSAKQSRASQDGGFTSRSNGAAVGYDKKISPTSRLGIAASYANSRVKSSNGLKRTDVDTYQANVYYGKSFGKYFFDTIVGFAWNEYDSHRSILGVSSAATAQYSGQSYISRVRTGFDNNLGSGFSLTPEVSLNFVHNVNSAYSEQGAGTASLDVHTSATNFLEGRAGLKLSHNMFTNNGNEFMQEIRASYGYDFIGDRQTITSNFVGQTASFTALSSRIDQRSLRLGAGFELTNVNEVTVSIDYNFEKKADYQSHSGILKARYGF